MNRKSAAGGHPAERWPAERRPAERRPAGALEAEVLRVLWDAGVPLTPTQLQERMGAELAYNTVHTVLTRLCDKGMLARTRRAGRAAYHPVQAQVEHGAAQLRAVLDAAHDRGEVLRRFIDTLTPQEEAALRAWLRVSDWDGATGGGDAG